MINDLYKDIINSFNTPPTLEIKKQTENKEIKELEKHVKKLLESKSKKRTRQKALMILKNKIQDIGKKHHLKISRIINFDKINTEELDFALEIIRDTKKSKSLFIQIDDYREKNFIFSVIQSNIVSKHNIQSKTNDYLNQIIKIENDTYPKNPIKRIIEKRKRKKQLDNIKNKLSYMVCKITTNIEEQNSLRETLNKTPFDAEKFKNAVNELINEQIKILEIQQNEIVIQQYKNRSMISLKQDKFNRITSFQKDDYLSLIAQKSFRKNPEKKNEFISKIIFILKLIDFIEKNDEIAIKELTQLMQKRIILENINQAIKNDPTLQEGKNMLSFK